MCITLPFLLLGSFSSSTSDLIKWQFRKKIRPVLTLKVYILSLRHFKDQLYLLWEQGTSGYLSFGHWSRVSGLGGLPECGSLSLQHFQIWHYTLDTSGCHMASRSPPVESSSRTVHWCSWSCTQHIGHREGRSHPILPSPAYSGTPSSTAHTCRVFARPGHWAMRLQSFLPISAYGTSHEFSAPG